MPNDEVAIAHVMEWLDGATLLGTTLDAVEDSVGWQKFDLASNKSNSTS